MDGATTIEAIIGVGVVFGLCLWRERQPRRIGDPRLLPTIPIMIVCMVLLLGLLAHGISLLVGQPIGRLQ